MAVLLDPYISVNMNEHNINNQLTKSLERIIEDAYLSGELNLSERKLKEYPKPVKYDLTDTVVADLSKNRFTDLPDEVTSYLYLEKLCLSHNIIRTIPDAVGSLQSLTYLDLSSNQLTELPREICQMPLHVLLVSDNMLTSLPKEIGKMNSLAELDASVNRLTQVPMTLGDCAGMRILDVSNNQLGLLPLQITYLRLEHLDVSCNCISSLPLELRNMSSLITLHLENNPLVSPPTTVCMRGRVHIFKYLDNLANKDSLVAHKRVEETRRTTKHSSYMSTTPIQATNHQIISGNATIDCLRHRPRPVVDSGYSTDGVDKRWCNDPSGEAGGGSGRSTPSTPSTLSPGTALSRAHSLSSETPLAPMLAGFRISPEGNMSNGDDKSKLAHQQTYRQYKEALKQQRQQDVYRSRTDQPSPDLDSSPHSQNQSPVHFQRSQSSPHSPVANGYSSNTSSSFYNRTLLSNSSISSTPNSSQSSPLLHSTPRRFYNIQNGNVTDSKPEEIKRPVQKVVPSRSVTNKHTSGSLTNGNVDYQNDRSLRSNGDSYIKPTSPTKSPTNTLGANRRGALNGEAGAKLLTTTVSYLKGASSKPPGAGKMAWNKDVAPDKLSFTMKREFDKHKEESDLLQQLRAIIESRLKMSLPPELPPVLCDGVVLCHLANHVRPRSVASVHVPSPAQPKLTMARCRRNVDNFLEACRRIGVEEETICTAEDILSHHPEYGGPSPGPGLGPLAVTVAGLLTHATTQQRSPNDFNRQYNRDRSHPSGTQNIGPSQIYQQNVDPTQIYQQNVDPTQNYQQNVDPSQFYQQNVDPSQFYQQNVDPSQIYQQNIDPFQVYQQNVDPSVFYLDRSEQITCEESSYQLNYYRSKQVYRSRYTEDRIVSDCNAYTNGYNQQYTIDETEEYQAGYDNNNTDYTQNLQNTDGLRSRSYNCNKVQFVTPFFNDNCVLRSGDFEIYDTDEVDGPIDSNVERYDRAKMDLNIEYNLNKQLDERKYTNDDDKRFLVTVLCLGSFLLSLILLVLFPL